MGTLQTSAGTLVFWLTVWVEQIVQFIWYLVTELVKIFQNVSSVTSILWRQVCEFLCGWATEQPLRSLPSREKSCTVFWRRLRPANRNIIKRSFFANIYQCWRELQFTCLRSFSPCGSDIYRRVYLKVRESDSPSFIDGKGALILKSSQQSNPRAFFHCLRAV